MLRSATLDLPGQVHPVRRLFTKLPVSVAQDDPYANKGPDEAVPYPAQLLAYMDDLRVKHVLDGSEVIVTHPGTSQYAGGGVSACGLAAMNCARVILGKEQAGERDGVLLKDMMSRATMEEIVAICSKWHSDAHLELEDIYRLPLFFKRLAPVSTTKYATSSFEQFQNLLLQLRDSPETYGKSAVVIITRPPEIIACFKIHTSQGGDVFVMFDSHPRPNHPLGAGFTFNTSIHATIGHLDALFTVDGAIFNDPDMQWQAQLLGNFSSQIYISRGSVVGESENMSETIIESNLALLASQAEVSSLKSRVSSLTTENKRLETRIEREERAREEQKISFSNVQDHVRRLQMEVEEKTRQNREEIVFRTTLATSLTEECNRLQSGILEKEERYRDERLAQSDRVTWATGEIRRLERDVQRLREERQDQVTGRCAMAADIRRLEEEITRREESGSNQIERLLEENRRLKKQHNRHSFDSVGTGDESEDLIDFHSPTSSPIRDFNCGMSSSPRKTRLSEPDGDGSMMSAVRLVDMKKVDGITTDAISEKAGEQLLEDQWLHTEFQNQFGSQPEMLQSLHGKQNQFDDEDRRLRGERQKLLSEAQDMFHCVLCLDTHPLESVACVETCGHDFCRESIREYIISKVKEHRFPITCPQCAADSSVQEPGVISDIFIQLVGLPEEDYNTFIELQLVAFSVLTHCRLCNRSAFVDREEYNASAILSCPLPDCAYMWCKSCQQEILPFNEEHSCDGALELDRLMTSQGWKHCPGCQTPIQKEHGCNHMTCVSPGCNAHFCYVCGAMIIQSSSGQAIQAATNEHFRTCQLFEVPDDGSDEDSDED